MGVGLFHYFTNGLYIIDTNHENTYTHKVESIHPNPSDPCSNEWFSLIMSGESKLISITYDNFDIVPSGQYNASFNFPGLGYGQLKKEDLVKENGRIWLGKLCLSKSIIF